MAPSDDDASMMVNVVVSRQPPPANDAPVQKTATAVEQPRRRHGAPHAHATHAATSSLFTATPAAVPLTDEMRAAMRSKDDYAPSNGVGVGATDDDSTGAAYTQLGLNAALARHLAGKMHCPQPTPIQRASLAHFLSSPSGDDSGCTDQTPARDVILKAQTGSGKTLAYLLPILDQLMRLPAGENTRSEGGTMALVLCPTRELAHQVHDKLTTLLSVSYAGPRWIVSGLLTGGEKKKSEKARLRKGVTVLVATPGRLLDHLRTTQSFKTSRLRWLVMDESDRFEELGFARAVASIVDLLGGADDNIPQYRTVLCSATATESLTQLAGGSRALIDPLVISPDSYNNCNAVDGRVAVPNQLRQHFLVVPPKQRLVALCALIRKVHLNNVDGGGNNKQPPRRTIIFFSNCDSVDFHCAAISEEKQKEKLLLGEQEEKDNLNGPNNSFKPLADRFKFACSVYKLHGNIAHADRLRAFKQFTASASDAILLCTDVAARGLDWPGVQTIIQFDAPTDQRDYVHRIGRTARIGESGDAHLFLQPSEVAYLERLAALGVVGVQTNVDRLLAEGLLQWRPTKQSPDATTQALPAAIEKRFRDEATNWQHWLEQRVSDSKSLNALARRAFMSSVRAYSTHAASDKEIFHVRKLHLGHYVKSFGMRDAPSRVFTGTNHKQQPQSTSDKKKRRINSDGGSDDDDDKSAVKKPVLDKAFAQSDGVRSYASSHYTTNAADEFQIVRQAKKACKTG